MENIENCINGKEDWEVSEKDSIEEGDSEEGMVEDFNQEHREIELTSIGWDG